MAQTKILTTIYDNTFFHCFTFYGVIGLFHEALMSPYCYLQLINDQQRQNEKGLIPIAVGIHSLAIH